MNILDLYDRATAWLSKTKAERAHAADEYLALVAESCHALLEMSPQMTDKSALLQDKIRLLYSEASSVLGASLQAADLEVAMRALASARIYFWIVALDGKPTDELQALIARRGGPRGSGFVSLGIVERAILAMCPGESYYQPDLGRALDVLRAACLKDFAQLDVLRVSRGTR